MTLQGQEHRPRPEGKGSQDQKINPDLGLAYKVCSVHEIQETAICYLGEPVLLNCIRVVCFQDVVFSSSSRREIMIAGDNVHSAIYQIYRDGRAL